MTDDVIDTPQERAMEHDRPTLPLLEFVPTGDARVDGAMERLAVLETSPVDEHPAVYDDIHRRLQAALSDTLGDA